MDSMKEYQKFTDQTAIYEGAGTGSVEALEYVTLGLAGEAGEIANVVKKIRRDGTYDAEALAKELGDLFYYVARMATELGTSLNLVARDNMQKLLDRKDRGVLGGQGDER